ncbi:hypothetical protein ABZ467_35425 [Streptomyces sp. NPDC005727]|uniref:hypothetical protein n=1 Tax=Streptomyces sp. NPDC005727 TaxID=3157053 RepID=UPI00340410A5
MLRADPAARRAETERRLREETALEAQRAQIRRARAEREVEQRHRAIARRRALEEDAELARNQAPCTDCGLPESAGLCPVCSYRRRTDALVREAVDLAVAVRADHLDAAAVAELTQQCEADTPALLALACERACGPDVDPAWVAFTAPQVAQQIRDGRRAAALRQLLGTQEAVAEADAAYEAALQRGSRGAEAAADEAANAAGRRTCEFFVCWWYILHGAVTGENGGWICDGRSVGPRVVRILVLMRRRACQPGGRRQRTDSTQVVADVRLLNRMEFLAEALPGPRR